MNFKFLKVVFVGVVLSVSTFANAGLINVSMSDGTSVHRNMSTSAHFPTLWSGIYGSGTDYLVTYLQFDLSGIADSSIFNNITLSATTNAYQGDSLLNAYYVNDDTLGGNTFSGLTYSQFSTYDDLLGSESSAGISTYSWDLTGFDYTSDLVDNTLTLAIASSSRADANHWVVFNRDFELAIDYSEVPEPSTLAIFALGIIGLASRRFKK